MPRTKLLILLILAGLLALSVPAVARAQGEEPPHGNANCLMCHSDPDFIGHFANGDNVSMFINPATYYRSVHADAGLECLACHTNQKEYPHRASEQVTCTTCHNLLGGDENTEYQALSVELAYADARTLTLEANEECRSCHEKNFEESVDSAHARVLAGGNPDAPVCIDCHGSHDITPPNQPRSKISQTCAECHQSVYTTYRTSVHGDALETEGNPDVPTCVDCHGVHNVVGPRDPNFRNDTITICGSCHADEERMGKYGISADVFQTYLSDFHGRTVNFFRRKSDNYPSNKATCFDCHGIHNIRCHDDPLSTVYPENLQGTCQQCHANANITFPEAWLSHYSPSWERTPVLYAVDVGYSFFVPGLIGAFMVYIGLDVRKRFAQRRPPVRKFIELDNENHDENTNDTN